MMPSIPGYFVGVGLLLTFIGLVLALSVAGSAVSSGDSGEMQGATEELLRVASFKFATSIAGLGTSIALGIAFRSIGINIETRCARLCSEIEAVLLYRSPQSISVEMASDLREQRDYLKDITQGDFFQRFGQEFEPRLQSAVSSAMAPVVSGIENAVSELSDQSRQGTEELVGQFTESLQQGAGEEMRALASAFEGIQANLSTLQGTLQDTGRDFGQDIEKAGASLAETLTRAAATAEAFERAAANVRRSTEPLLESGDKISNAVDKMEASLVKTADALEAEQKAIADLSKTLADQMRQQEELWSQYGSRFEGIDGALGAALERLSEASREQGERLMEYALRVDEGLAEAVDKLRAFLGGLDENTQDFSESVENLARTLEQKRPRQDGVRNDPI
jgi:septal ring factor EnvC (AmiA/AmiB activator)